MPMMEKAMEKFLFSVPELSADKAEDTQAEWSQSIKNSSASENLNVTNYELHIFYE